MDLFDPVNIHCAQKNLGWNDSFTNSNIHSACIGLNSTSAVLPHQNVVTKALCVGRKDWLSPAICMINNLEVNLLRFFVHSVYRPSQGCFSVGTRGNAVPTLFWSLFWRGNALPQFFGRKKKQGCDSSVFCRISGRAPYEQSHP